MAQGDVLDVPIEYEQLVFHFAPPPVSLVIPSPPNSTVGHLGGHYIPLSWNWREYMYGLGRRRHPDELNDNNILVTDLQTSRRRVKGGAELWSPLEGEANDFNIPDSRDWPDFNAAQYNTNPFPVVPFHGPRSLWSESDVMAEIAANSPEIATEGSRAEARGQETISWTGLYSRDLRPPKEEYSPMEEGGAIFFEEFKIFYDHCTNIPIFFTKEELDKTDHGTNMYFDLNPVYNYYDRVYEEIITPNFDEKQLPNFYRWKPDPENKGPLGIQPRHWTDPNEGIFCLPQNTGTPREITTQELIKKYGVLPNYWASRPWYVHPDPTDERFLVPYNERNLHQMYVDFEFTSLHKSLFAQSLKFGNGGLNLMSEVLQPFAETLGLCGMVSRNERIGALGGPDYDCMVGYPEQWHPSGTPAWTGPMKGLDFLITTQSITSGTDQDRRRERTMDIARIRIESWLEQGLGNQNADDPQRLEEVRATIDDLADMYNLPRYEPQSETMDEALERVSRPFLEPGTISGKANLAISDTSIERLRTLKVDEWFDELFEVDDTTSMAERFRRVFMKYVLRARIRKMVREHRRTLYDILKGKMAHSEIIGYRIEKRFTDTVGDPSNDSENFYFGTNDDVEIVKYIDSQVKYGKSCTYRVYALTAVVGTRYAYTDCMSTVQLRDFYDLSELYTQEGVDETDQELIMPFGVMHKPDVRIIEIPCQQRTIEILDSPPIHPNVDIIPFKGDKNHILFNLDSNTGEFFAEPIILEDDDRDQFPQVDGLVHFKNDDPVKIFEIFRVEEEPTSWESFYDQKINRIESNATAASFVDTILPNRKYYYTFRTEDIHGHVSNPSHIYEIELVSDLEVVYLKSNIFYFKEKERKKKESFQRFMEINPTYMQRLFPMPDAPLLQEWERLGAQLDSSDYPVWGKRFKLRVTSKSTGKQVDINFKFVLNYNRIREQVENPQCP